MKTSNVHTLVAGKLGNLVNYTPLISNNILIIFSATNNSCQLYSNSNWLKTILVENY